MKLTSLLSLVFTLGLVACGSGNPAEEVAEEQAGVMLEMAGIVEGIQNGEDLEDAKSEMKRLADQMKELSQKWAQLQMDGVSAEELSAAVEGNSKLNEATERYRAAMMNLLNNPELAAEFGEIMQEPGNDAGR